MSARDRDSVWPGTASLVPEALRAAPSRLSPGKAGILALKRRRLVFRAASLLPGRPFVARVSPRRQHPVITTRIAENIPVICARSFHASHDNTTRHGYLEMVAGGQTLGTRHAVSVAETIDAYPADSRRACDIAPSLPPYPVDRAPHRNLRDPRTAGDLLALLASRARRAAGPDHSSLREWPALDGRATHRGDLRVAPGAELGSPRADSAAGRRRRARGRGPAVLDSSGDRSARRGAGLSCQSQAGRAPRGRQHHHPAAGADPVPRHPTHVGTKGSGGPHRPSPRSPVFQAAHPRGLSQFRLS